MSFYMAETRSKIPNALIIFDWTNEFEVFFTFSVVAFRLLVVDVLAVLVIPVAVIAQHVMGIALVDAGAAVALAGADHLWRHHIVDAGNPGQVGSENEG